MTVTEELDYVRGLLRVTCAAAMELPREVQAWWEQERAAIAAEEKAQAQTRADRRAGIKQQIDQLQIELAALK